MLTVLLSFWFNSVNNEGVLSLFTLFFWKGSDKALKNHQFWAWAAVICFAMTMYTGYKHK